MQAGRRWRFRRAATRSIGASDRRFPSRFDGGRETSRAATHVESFEGVLSDAGSTPAASTISKSLNLNDLQIQRFLVYLICPKLAVDCRHGPRDLPAPLHQLQILRTAAPRCAQPELQVPDLGAGFARPRVSPTES